MARETLPGADERDGEMDVTRERLDGQPLSGWRAPLAAWLERIGAWFGAVATPEPSPISAAADAAASSAAGWERRLTARQKLARGLLATLVVALALFGLLNGPLAARGALRALDAALHPPQPPPSITASDYALQRLPQPAQHLPRIALAPVLARPGVAYACWVNPYKPAPNDILGATAVYKTTDLASSWTRLTFPALEAVDCDVVTDAAGSDEALVIVSPKYSTYGSCQAPRLFLTPDGGATWREVLWGNPEPPVACDTRFALEGGAIYSWSTQPLLASAQAADTMGRLIVTRDDGGTWTAADNGIGYDAGLDVVALRSGGRILMTMPDITGPPGSAMLMESSDYGATWRDLGDAPGAFPAVYASTDPNVTNGGGWGQLYVIGRPLINGAPAGDSQVFLATGTIGHGWTPLLLPPLTPGDTLNANTTDPDVLGVGPDGSLFVEHGIVPTNDETQLSPARRVWAWSVSRSRWLPDPQPELGNSISLDWAWNHGQMTFWVVSLQLGVPPTLQMFTKTYTAASLGPAR